MNHRIDTRLIKTAACLASLLLIYCSPAYAAPKMAARNTACIKIYGDWVFGHAPKAFALSESFGTDKTGVVQGCGSSWGASSEQAARETAIARCKRSVRHRPEAARTCQVVNLRHIILGPGP